MKQQYFFIINLEMLKLKIVYNSKLFLVKCFPLETTILFLFFKLIVGVYCWKRLEIIMKLIEAIGIRLDNLINENKITIYELAKRAGVPRSTVWKIIHPDLTRVKTVKIDTIYQLADSFGIKLKEFFDNPIFDEVND